MTFEEFQASGRDVEDMAADKDGAANSFEGPGRVYHGGLFVERALHARDLYHLTINNAQWSDYGPEGLERLERKLYSWACGEGYC